MTPHGEESDETKTFRRLMVRHGQIIVVKLNGVLEACVACHLAYRVDERGPGNARTTRDR